MSRNASSIARTNTSVLGDEHRHDPCAFEECLDLLHHAPPNHPSTATTIPAAAPRPTSRLQAKAAFERPRLLSRAGPSPRCDGASATRATRARPFSAPVKSHLCASRQSSRSPSPSGLFHAAESVRAGESGSVESERCPTRTSWERCVLQTRASRPHRSAVVLPSHLRARRPRSQDVRSQEERWASTPGRESVGVKRP